MLKSGVAEIDRYQNKKYEECFCKSCEQHDIENLFRVLVSCQEYKESRKPMLPFMIDVEVSFSQLQEANHQRNKTNFRVYAESQNQK